MTVNAKIKALECFALDKEFDDSQCVGCAFEHKFCTANMSVDIANLALDFISRQKAEIERLHNILLSFTNEVHTWSNKKGYDTTELSLIPILNEAESVRKIIKAEAVKEFTERFKDIAGIYQKDTWVIGVDEFDNLLKETVGDTE